MPTVTQPRPRPVQFPLQTSDVPHRVDAAIFSARRAGAGITTCERVLVFCWSGWGSGDIPSDAEIGRAVGCTEERAREYVRELISEGLFPQYLDDDSTDPADSDESALDQTALAAISARKRELAGRGPWAESRRMLGRGARVAREKRREGMEV
jgi:hypothetical protein